MKETTPQLTQEKKKESEKYIKYIYERTGIRFKCRKIKDYIFIKMLYLLLVDYEEMENEFYLEIKNHYIESSNFQKIESANYFGYDLNDVIKQYVIKYYYGDITNFAVNWEYYNYLTFNQFEKKLNRAYTSLNKRLEIENKKMEKLFDNVGIRMIDENTFAEFEKKEGLLKWITQKDEFVCEYCASLNGNIYRRISEIPERHPNCRCEIITIYQ